MFVFAEPTNIVNVKVVLPESGVAVMKLSPGDIIHGLNGTAESLELPDGVVLHLAVVINTDHLNQQFLNEIKCSDTNCGFIDAVQHAQPVDFTGILLVEWLIESPDDGTGSDGEYGPEEQRQWNFNRFEHQKVLSDAGT